MATIQITAAEIIRQLQICADIRKLLGENKTYFIQTFGCQQNDNDSEKLAGLLQKMGYTPAVNRESADIVLINTCSVRENASDRFFGNLGILKPLKKSNPGMLICTCGCMMKQEEVVEKIKRSYPFVDVLLAPSDLYRFPELLWRRLNGTRRVYDITADDVVAEGIPVLHERKYRALCTIMYGCNNYCTYCIVPFTRGRERSRQPEEILRELQELAASGYTEVMLLGQNVNSYGRDLADKMSFAELLALAAEHSGLPRIRYMTSHPKDLSPELIDVMAAYPNIERHIHLPLQSGSDAVLRKMNRHYNIARYMSIVDLAKRKIPDLSITTDIIVGFPGETEADFAETLRIVGEVGYDSAFTFQYSPRPGTPAAKWTNQVPAEVVSERFDRLVTLQNQNSLAANLRRLNRSGEVLIEGISDHNPGMFTGRFSDNHLINFEIPANELAALSGRTLSPIAAAGIVEGKLAQVKVTEAKTFSLQGAWERWL